MTINGALKFAACVSTLLFLSGCLVKPPPDDNLGAPIDIQSINDAMSQAQAGVDPQKGFQKGDSGTVLSVYSTTTASQIAETDLYTITAATSTTFTVQEIANLAATSTAPASSTTTTTGYYRPGAAPTPTPTPISTPTATPASGSITSKIDSPKPSNFLMKIATGTFNYLARLFSKVSIQPSTAIGEGTLPKELIPGSIHLRKGFGPWTLNSELSVRGKTREVAALDLTPVASPAASPTPAEPTITSDQYYRLIVQPDTVLTKNCAQIPNCSVNTTHIQFEEILTTSAGQSVRLHWSYEFSPTVPGLFTVLARCWSQIETVNGIQSPLTYCDSQLDDFRWGNPGNL